MILCYRSKGTFTNLKLGFASTQLLLNVTDSSVKGFPFKTVRKRETNVTTFAKKTTQTSLFPCPTDPVPGVQIMGTAKRNVSKIEKGEGVGSGRGWERAREPVPSSLPLYFFPALLLRATLHHPNASNRLCPRKKIGEVCMRMRANGGAGQ